VFPIYWMVVSSVKTNFELLSGSNVSLLPDLRTLQLQNYVSMWTNLNLAIYLRNSLIVCGVATLISVALAALSGFGLAYFRFRGSGGYSIAVMATQLLPGIMFLLPIYLIAKNLGLLDNIVTLVIIYAAMNLPVAVWMMRSFLAEVPVEVLEAAAIDGASLPTVMRRVIVPMTSPGIAATALICFIFSWNELLFARVLTGVVAGTAPVFLTGFVTSQGLFLAKVCAAAVAISLPVLAAGFAAQDKLVQGLSLGAVK